MSNTKVALCPECHGKRMILHRTDTRGVPAAYWFACSDCLTTTANAPTLKLVAKLVEWVPIDAQLE